MNTENISFYSVVTGITTTVIGASIASLLGAITYIQWQDHQLTYKNSINLRVVIERVDGVIERLDAIVPNISEQDAETQHAAMLEFIDDNKERLVGFQKRLVDFERRIDRLERGDNP